MYITVSVVSHGHGLMIQELILLLLKSELVNKIICTFNIHETLQLPDDSKLVTIYNASPKGFGSNHNTAFKHCNTPYFCVINPDITFKNDPFHSLIEAFKYKVNLCRYGVMGPLVVDKEMKVQDSARKFISFLSIVLRITKIKLGNENLNFENEVNRVDWISGMFMLFKSIAYKSVYGFDEKFFMYCEDADICERLWKANYAVGVHMRSIVTHDARRDSHKKFLNFKYHFKSLVRLILINKIIKCRFKFNNKR
jgi:N-acetylglucosaminyl-diphospho-decaprenol L-rhamnosyltransferase